MQTRLEASLAETGLDGLVVFSGTAAAPPRDDVALPFRAEPHFLSWLPLPRLQGAALVLGPGRQPELVFPRESDFWEAPSVEPRGDWVEHFEIHYAESLPAASKLAMKLAASRFGPRGYAVLGAERVGADIGGPDSRPEAQALRSRLDYARGVKTAFEIEQMARANRIAARGHRDVARRFAAGASEFDLHQTYLDATRLREQEFPYQNIVALNEHGAVLHYQHLETEPPTESLSLLIDAGAQCSGYAADVTRTASATDEFRALIDSMEALQQSICTQVAAGVDYVALNERTHVELAAVLAEHAIVTCSAEAAYDSGLTRLFLPHGLGHLLGLQVHDVGGTQVSPAGEERAPPDSHPFLRLTRTLEPGMTLTIEPGLYFIGALLDSVSPEQRRALGTASIERLRRYGGIRIEDNLAVEASGGRNLTREAFAALDG
jgi:Xaa-Pro dipeptidase